MSSRTRFVPRGAWLPLLVLAAWSCQKGPTPQEQARMQDLSTAAEERDKLLQEMSETARLLAEISAEVAKVQVPARELRVSSESPLRASRDSMLRRIKYISARVAESDARLRESSARIKNLTSLSDSLRAMLDSTITNFETVVESQRQTITALNDQVSGLLAANAALQDTLTHVSTRANTVYYIVGTEEELIDRGLVVKEGGSRFLFILWKSGQTLQPARELDPAAFTPIDRRTFTEIPLPDPSAEYRIASRQDPNYLETPPGEDAKITGMPVLKIADSERFWNPSKFLILVKSGGGGPAATASLN